MDQKYIDALRPNCPQCGEKATTASVMFSMGDATCKPCSIGWKYWWEDKQPVGSSIYPIAPGLAEDLEKRRQR